jgi:hypothetical protein
MVSISARKARALQFCLYDIGEQAVDLFCLDSESVVSILLAMAIRIARKCKKELRNHRAFFTIEFLRLEL